MRAVVQPMHIRGGRPAASWLPVGSWSSHTRFISNSQIHDDMGFPGVGLIAVNALANVFGGSIHASVAEAALVRLIERTTHKANLDRTDWKVSRNVF